MARSKMDYLHQQGDCIQFTPLTRTYTQVITWWWSRANYSVIQRNLSIINKGGQSEIISIQISQVSSLWVWETCKLPSVVCSRANCVSNFNKLNLVGLEWAWRSSDAQIECKWWERWMDELYWMLVCLHNRNDNNCHHDDQHVMIHGADSPACLLQISQAGGWTRKQATHSMLQCSWC